jgi:hypothetical protein
VVTPAPIIGWHRSRLRSAIRLPTSMWGHIGATIRREPLGIEAMRGSGFGIAARPTGAYVIRRDQVKWMPAVDANRVIAGVFAIAALALLVALRRSK